ncbi:hypothetical protein Gotri_015810, partial [Gossypium trilobum]|nr:hypothetical protein [Gossypium trilobum]
QLFDSAGHQSLDYFLLSIYKGEITVKPSDEVFEEEAQCWQHSLVAQFIGKKGLSYTVSGIGTPLYMDRIIASRSHLAFAKICIEVPVDVVMVKEKFRKPIKVNSLHVAHVVVELGHCVSELSLSALKKGKEAVLPVVFDVIIDDFVVFGTMVDGFDLVAIDPGFVAECFGFDGTQSCTSNMKKFRDYVSLLEVTDLGAIGPTFIWSNLQQSNFIAKKLDRVLVNFSWLLEFPHSHAEFLALGVSDHCPSVVWFDKPGLSPPKRFK